MTNGAVWKFDPASGAWTDITPVKPAGDISGTPRWRWMPTIRGRMIASTFGRMNGNGGEDDMFRSIDAGATWKPVFGGTAATGGAGTFDNAPGALRDAHANPLDVRYRNRPNG